MRNQKTPYKKRLFFLSQLAVLALLIFGTPMLTATVGAAPFSDPTQTPYHCGEGDKAVNTAINFGCRGEGNPIVDMLYAAIRFLSAGVGIVIVGVVMFAGVQYTFAQGEPQKQAAARMRVINALLALLLYIFTYAILQFIIPGGLFR